MEREGKFRLRSEGHEETTPVRTLSEIHENVIYERLCDIEEKQRKWIETSKTLGNPQSEKEGEEQREWIRSVTFRGTNQYTPKKGGNTHVKVITPPLKSAITPPRRSAVTPPQKGRLTPPQTGVITPKSSTLGYFNVPNLKLHASHVPATSIEPLVKPDAEFISDDGKLVKILKIEAPPVVLRPTRDTTPKKPKPNTSHSINKSEINKMTDFDGKSTDSLIARLNLEIEKVDREEKKIEKMIKEKKSPSKHIPTTPKKIVVPEKDECVKPSPPKVKTYDVKVTRDFIRQKQKEREERALEEKKKKEIETEEKKKKLIELKETQKRILRSCKRRMINDKPQWIGPLEVVAKDKKEKSPVRRPRSRETPKLHMNYSNENVEKMRQKAETVRNVFLKSNEQEPENLISIPGELENSIVEPDDFQHEVVKNVKKKRNKDSPMKDGDCVRKEKRQKTHKMGAKSYFEAAPWENPLSNKEVKKEDRPVTPDWLKELAEQPDPFNLINTFKRKLRMVDVKENTNQVEINVIDEDLLNLSAERISRYALTTKKDEIAADSLKLSQSLDQLNLKYPQIEKDSSDADDATYNVEKVETKNVLVSVNFDDLKAKNKENATQTSVPLMPYNLVTSSFLYPAFDYQPLYSSENGQIVQKVYAESVFSESSDSVSEIVQISRTLTKNRKKKMREEGAHGVMQVTSLRSSIHDPPFNFYDSASSADKNTTYTSVESYSQSNYEEKPLEMKIAKITTQVLEDMRETNPVQKSLDLRSNSSIQKAKEELEEMESVRLKLIEKGKDIEASSLKKRERALMLKLYQDLKEIARLRKLEKAKVNETESIANQMKVLKEKEETLKERQKNVEAIVAWKQRLEQEEQKIKKIESVIAHSPFNSPLPITFPRTIDRGTSPILGLNKPNLDSDNCSDSLERSSVSEHTLKNVTIRRHPNRVQYRRRSVGLNSPLTPRVTIMKRRNSTGSDESVTMSQNDTLSEQSDMESRVSALQHQLKERKIVLEKLKKEYNKSQRERLRAKEQSLLNQIQAYDSYIEQIKTDLQNEMEKDNVKVTKPQIKQPKFEKKKTKIEEKSELKLDKSECDKTEESETSQSKTLKPNETDASGLISASEFLIDSKSKIETENIKTSLEMGEIGKDATLKSVSEIIQTKDSQDTSLVSVSEIDQIEYSKSMSEILQSLIQESSLRSISENISDNKTLKTVSEEKTLKSASEEKTLKSVSEEKTLKSASEEKTLKSVSEEKTLKSASEEKTLKSVSEEKTLKSASEEKTLKSVSEEKTLKTPSEVLKTPSDKTLRTASVETPKTVSETQKTEETLKTGSVETPETGSGDVEKSSGETPKTESGGTLKASREDLETSSTGRSHTVSGEIVKTSETPETAEELKTNEETTQTSKVEIPTVSREIPKVASEETKTLSEKSNIETLESISENLKSIQDEMEPEETNQSKLTDSSSPTLISETLEKLDSNRESVSEYLPTMKSESESKRSITNLLSEEENCRVGELEIDSGDMSKVIEMFGNGFGLEDKLWKENMDASEQMEKTPLLNALQREREKAINVDFLTQSICAEVINDATDATVEAYNKKKKFAEKYNERWNRGDGPWNEGLTPQAIREAEELRKKQLQIEQEIEQLEAQEVVPYFYMREIPNKPPPPYTPPKFLPPTKEEIISRVSDAVEILWDESLKGNDIHDIKSPSNYLSDIQDKSYVEFMFDLSKELFLKFKPKKVEASLPWIEKPMSKPLPPIRSKSDMLKYVENETEVVFGFKPKIMRENMIMKWSRKKRDLVDEILVRDLQDEEFEWTNFTLEENLVKNQISDSIADFMISEAAEGLKEAFLKKIVNFR